jgi:predicted phage terminase large subunit-like protein
VIDYNYGIELEIKREVFKKSYYEFFKWSFNILEPQTRLEDTFHIKYLCDTLQKEVERIIRREAKGKDIIVNIPPRTSKSKIVSQSLLAWVWIIAPHLKMIAVSFDEKLTLTNAQYCKDIIKSVEYQELFGHLFQIRKDVDAKERFANDKGGERLSVTTGANITGFGAEIIIVDDPQNPKTAESEVERENTTRYYVESLYNRLTPINLGIRIVVQQRLHHEDLTGYLLKHDPDGYNHICLPAELSSDVRPKELAVNYRDGLLDPIRLNRIELLKLKKQGSRYYAGQYMQIPSPDEGGIIKRAWFDIIEPKELLREPINEPIHFFIDSAYTAKTTNDPTAILACYKRNNDLIICDAIEQWLEFPDLIKFLVEYVQKYQLSANSKIFIEEAASGLSIVQQLRSITNLNIVGIPKPKDDKVTRTHAITGKLEGRRVKLVKGKYIENFINQLAAFPTGKHDDMLDTLIHAVNQLLIDAETPDVFWI